MQSIDKLIAGLEEAKTLISKRVPQLRQGHAYGAVRDAIVLLHEQQTSTNTDHRMVSVEDVLETIRDMAHHPDHMFRAQDLLDDLERRLMR